jgi:hypothetical protein
MPSSLQKEAVNSGKECNRTWRESEQVGRAISSYVVSLNKDREGSKFVSFDGTDSDANHATVVKRNRHWLLNNQPYY